MDEFKAVIQCYVDMGIKEKAKPIKSGGTYTWKGVQSLIFYETELENHYLQQMATSFAENVQKWKNQLEETEYTQEFEKSLTIEEEFIDSVLRTETKAKVR